MTLHIDGDSKRFKDIIRGKVKSNLSKYVGSQKILGQQGAKTIAIPINSIDLPRFTFGNREGGASQGSGNPGDPIGGSDGEGDGSKAGDQEGEHAYEEEFTPAELASILGEVLELPDLEDKGADNIETASNRYTGVSRVGPEGLRSVRRSYKQALKRSIASGTYDPEKPSIVPIKDDMRYRAPKMVEKPETKAAILYLQDVSGSMGESEKHRVRSFCFWTSLWLQHQYPGLEERFIVHDSIAKEVKRDEFFTLSESGGTIISSAYQLAIDIMKADYPFESTNVYVVHASDGDNWSDSDNNLAVAMLKNGIMPNANLFGYVQTTSKTGSGEFLNVLSNAFAPYDNIALAKVDDEGDILPAIKVLFGK